MTAEVKKVDPSTFADGWSIRNENDWLVAIAREHAKIKYPGFYSLCPGCQFSEIEVDMLSKEQLAFCNDYWNNILAGPSQAALAARRALTRGRPIKCPELDSKIFVIEWDAQNNRAKKGTGQWLSYHGTKPSFRFGISPKSGKIGDWKVEDTHRDKFSKITVRSLAALLEEIMKICGCDREAAESIHHTGRNKKGFFVSHGSSLWSGTHPSVANPSDAEIEKARAALAQEKASRKPKTDVQVKLWILFGAMPETHVNDIPGWVIKDPQRIGILEQFQASSPSTEIREMDLEEYAHYKWRNLCDERAEAKT